MLGDSRGNIGPKSDRNRGAARRAGRAVVADLAAPLRARDAEPEAALLGNVPLLAGDEAGEDPDEALGDESGEEPGEEPA